MLDICRAEEYVYKRRKPGLTPTAPVVLECATLRVGGMLTTPRTYTGAPAGRPHPARMEGQRLDRERALHAGAFFIYA